jgi:hypothetical protein
VGLDDVALVAPAIRSTGRKEFRACEAIHTRIHAGALSRHHNLDHTIAGRLACLCAAGCVLKSGGPAPPHEKLPGVETIFAGR